MKLWILIGTWQFTLRLPDPTVFLRGFRRSYKGASVKE
jgi:hypothetical protein